jgi:hypothetical protein
MMGFMGWRGKESVIGKRGELYLENLKAGKFPAKITSAEKQCVFQMVVPESQGMIVVAHIPKSAQF